MTRLSAVRLRRGSALAALCWALAPAAGARAAPSAPSPSLTSRLGRPAAARGLRSRSVEPRLRAIRRLGRLGTSWAVEQLEKHAVLLDERLDSREWLALARAVAPRAELPAARRLLTRIAGHRPADSAVPPDVAMVRLANHAAALGLAAEGSDASLGALGRALRAGGVAARVAADALLAHPPARLDVILNGPGEPSAPLAEWLGKLGDQRAFHALRDWVRGGSAEVRAASALALTRLGHLETVPLARDWLGHEVPELSRAALEILLYADHPAGVAELGRRLAGPRPSSWLVALALEHPRAGLLPRLLQASASAAPEPWFWTLIGRVGGPVAARRLGRALRGDAAFEAAHALSRLPLPVADAELAAVIADGVALPAAVRAAAVRAPGGDVSALSEVLAALSASARPEERAAAAWVRSLVDADAALELLSSGDPVMVAAAARHVLSLDDSIVERAAPLLAAAPAGPLRLALSALLARSEARRQTPSRVLFELVDDESAARPLALRALAERDDVRARPLIERHLHGEDALLRAHVARGLGESPRSSAVGLLLERFEWETNDDVRWAIVASLGTWLRRTGSRTARDALASAARLDASARVRSAARLSLRGIAIGDPALRGSAARASCHWLRLRDVRAPDVAASAGAPSGKGGLVASLSVAPGLSLPLPRGPGGWVVASGVGGDALGIRLIWTDHSF